MLDGLFLVNWYEYYSLFLNRHGSASFNTCITAVYAKPRGRHGRSWAGKMDKPKRIKTNERKSRMNEWTNGQSGFSDWQKNYPVRRIDMIWQSAAFPYTEEARKLAFRALTLRRSESRNCGLWVVYIQNEWMQLRYWLEHGNVENTRIN